MIPRGLRVDGGMIETTDSIEIPFKSARGYEPEYQSSGAAGADLRACIEGEITLAPGERTVVPTSVYIAIPSGYEGQVRPRSGLATRHGITVVNAPGTIDSDYRGEIRVALINLSDTAYSITPGERIAQLVIAPVVHARFGYHEQLDVTERGEGGFGSTGR